MEQNTDTQSRKYTGNCRHDSWVEQQSDVSSGIAELSRTRVTAGTIAKLNSAIQEQEPIKSKTKQQEPEQWPALSAGKRSVIKGVNRFNRVQTAT